MTAADSRILLLAAFPLFALWGCQVTAEGDDDATTDDDSASDDDVSDDDTVPEITPDPDVHTYLPKNYRADNPTRLLVFGDSISAGNGASRDSLDYVSLLIENNEDEWPDWNDYDLQSLHPNLSEVIDVSFGGALTIDVVNDQIPDLESQLSYPAEGQTLVVITAGGNDAQMALAVPDMLDNIIESVETNLTDFVEYMQDPAKFPDGVWIYAANVYEPTDGVGQSDSCFFGFEFTDLLPGLDEANATMQGVAEDYSFAMLDLHGHFGGHGYYHDDPENALYDAEDPTLWFASDCIHPNDRGHHELRRMMYHSIDGQPLPAPGQ